MNVGDKVKFTFAKKEMEGQVTKIFQKNVYLKADFPKDKGKIVKRKIKDIKEWGFRGQANHSNAQPLGSLAPIFKCSSPEWPSPEGLLFSSFQWHIQQVSAWQGCCI